MNSIEALERDIFLQPKLLKTFKGAKQASATKQKKFLFCGSGDSLASAMLAEVHSDFKARAADPLELARNRSLADGKEVFVISISGRTVANIKAARRADRVTTITSNPKSRMARISHKIMLLRFPNSDVVTAGTMSFIESALTCMSLVRRIRITNPDKIFQSAVKQSKGISLGKKTFFLGNLQTYPLAMYAAAKIFEIIGSSAIYERLEQFSHMGLFSIKDNDTVVIFEPKNQYNLKLATQLRKAGIKTIHPSPPQKDPISQFLFYSFFSQLVPFFLAKERGQKECHFITAKKLRKISDEMIYYTRFNS